MGRARDPVGVQATDNTQTPARGDRFRVLDQVFQIDDFQSSRRGLLSCGRLGRKCEGKHPFPGWRADSFDVTDSLRDSDPKLIWRMST